MQEKKLNTNPMRLNRLKIILLGKNENNRKIITFLFGFNITYMLYLYSDNRKLSQSKKRRSNSIIRLEML